MTIRFVGTELGDAATTYGASATTQLAPTSVDHEWTLTVEAANETADGWQAAIEFLDESRKVMLGTEGHTSALQTSTDTAVATMTATAPAGAAWVQGRVKLQESDDNQTITVDWAELLETSDDASVLIDGTMTVRCIGPTDDSGSSLSRRLAYLVQQTLDGREISVAGSRVRISTSVEAVSSTEQLVTVSLERIA